MGSLEFAMKLQSTKAPYPGHLAQKQPPGVAFSYCNLQGLLLFFISTHSKISWIVSNALNAVA